jgi:hypothetical protein
METLITTAKLKLDATQFASTLASKYRKLLDTDFDQNWTRISPTCINDQFGFVIDMEIIDGNERFELSWKGNTICQVNRLTTAKLISCILMNDIVLFTPLNN